MTETSAPAFNAQSGASFAGRFGDEAGRLAGGIGDFAGQVGAVVGEVAGGVADITRSSAGNPWMQGLGGVMAFVLGWALTERFSQGVPGLLRMALVPGIAALFAFGAATLIGTAREQPGADAAADPASVSAASDPRLQEARAAAPAIPAAPVVPPAAPG